MPGKRIRVEYRMDVRQRLNCYVKGMTGITILGVLFYQSWISVFVLFLLLFPYIRWTGKEFEEKRKWQLNVEFKDALVSLSAAFHAGYSAEHGIEQAYKDLTLLYEEDSMIMRELAYIIRQIKLNITVEKALTEFGERSGIEDIISFAEVFATAKRTGGDLIQVVRTSSNVIRDKIEVRGEIKTLITAKKYEADIMKGIPLGFLCFLQVSTPGFLDPLYHNSLGIIVMTLLLCVYLGVVLLMKRIIMIEM